MPTFEIGSKTFPNEKKLHLIQLTFERHMSVLSFTSGSSLSFVALELVCHCRPRRVDGHEWHFVDYRVYISNVELYCRGAMEMNKYRYVSILAIGSEI